MSIQNMFYPSAFGTEYHSHQRTTYFPVQSPQCQLVKTVTSKRLATLFITLLSLAASTYATENYGVRYIPGIGGSNMSAPADPGLYGQVHVLYYRANRIKGSPQSSIVVRSITANYDTNAKLELKAVIPHLSYISTRKLFDANIGFSMLLPLVEQKVTTTANLTPTSRAELGAAANPTANKLFATAADGEHSGSKFGLSDLELGPVLRWNHDNQQLIWIPAILLGTGDFKAGRAYNPGTGKYHTFRPTWQYSYIGDGWDFGGRAAYAINTRNTDTQYRSGNTFYMDWALMRFVNDSTRLGVQGYAVYQVTKDSVKSAADGGISLYNHTSSTGIKEPIAAGKGRAYAIGPAISWIKDSGVLMVEGKLLREFGVKNRPDGYAAWLTIAKPLE